MDTDIRWIALIILSWGGSMAFFIGVMLGTCLDIMNISLYYLTYG